MNKDREWRRKNDVIQKGEVDENTIEYGLHHDTNIEEELFGLPTCFDLWIQLVYKNTDFRLGQGLRRLEYTC